MCKWFATLLSHRCFADAEENNEKETKEERNKEKKEKKTKKKDKVKESEELRKPNKTSKQERKSNSVRSKTFQRRFDLLYECLLSITPFICVLFIIEKNLTENPTPETEVHSQKHNKEKKADNEEEDVSGQPAPQSPKRRKQLDTSESETQSIL